MPARFAATLTALEKGAENMSADSAVKNIDAWEESLRDLDGKEAKAIVRDLDALKKELGKGDKASGEKVQELMGKLGQATTASAADAPDSIKDKLQQLGDALSGSGKG